MAKKATMKDVAELAGVSITSVSHVINKTRRVEDRTESAVLEAIEQLHYTPNILAQSLKGKRTRTIGVIIADIREDFFAEVVKSVEFSAAEKEYSVILCDSEESVAMERFYIDVLLSKGVDGIIFAPVDMDETYVNRLSPEIPFVQIDRKMSHYRADFVGIDNAGSAEAATCFLLEEGSRNVGFIGYTEKVFTQKLRVEGYRSALLSRGSEFDPARVLKVEYHQESTVDVIKAFLTGPKPIDGVVCGTSNICWETISAIDTLGLKIPGDIRVVSYDDSKWFDFLKYPVSVILQPTEAIGRLAVDLIIDRAENRLDDTKRQVILDTDLVVRR